MRPGSSHTGKRRRNRARGVSAPPSLAHPDRDACEAALGYKFKKPELLDRAMTHRSAVAGHAAEWSNERLEFLGDRVLGLIVSESLLERFPNTREGQLAPRLNSIVSRETCAVVGGELGLDRCLIVDKAERAAGGQTKPTLLANACEAVLGAVYLDGGLAAARKFVRKHWKTAFAASEELQRDPKSVLQEWAQGRKLSTPVYSLSRKGGSDHAPTFNAIVEIDGLEPATGSGGSKQDAERAAARAMLERIGDGDE